MKSINEFIAASAVIIFPASVLVVDRVYGAVFLLVILLGMWQMVIYRKEIFPVSKGEKLFFFSLCIVMVTVVITTVVNDTDMARADRFLAPVLAIPAYYFFKRNLFDEKYLWIGLVLGALIAAGTAIYQVTGLDYCPIREVRATGAVHWIIFGDLALLLGVLSLAGTGWFVGKNKWMVTLPVLAFVAGMIASALSLSRGGWVAIPFLGIIFLWYSSKKISLKIYVMSFLLVILAVVSLYLLPQSGVQKRVEVTVMNIEQYSDSNDIDDKLRATSIGARFEMWKAAWLIFKDAPLIGVGWGDYTKKVRGLIIQKLINRHIGYYYHPHNQFLSALAKGGLLGLIAIIVLLMLPAAIYYRSINFIQDTKLNRLALAGLLLIVGFTSFSLSDSFLEHSRTIIFISFYMVVFMSIVLRGNRKGA
jgi:O-antigen ligase